MVLKTLPICLGCMLDDERAKFYASIVDKGCAARFAFAATIFGESSEALFWLQLPQALKHVMNKLLRKPPPNTEVTISDVDETSLLSRISSRGKPTEETGRDVLVRCIIVSFDILSHDILGSVPHSSC